MPVVGFDEDKMVDQRLGILIILTKVGTKSR